MNFGGLHGRVRERVTTDPVLSAVVLLSLVALLARLVFLGGRVAHFDEGRVAYWALSYQETGAISYRYIVHGPLVQYVDAFLFGLLGQSDFAMRLPLSVFGGLLPLAALLFREHLGGSETVALAGFLAFNPALLYYSRFLRSTLLVAGFAFVAFGMFVRAYDTRRVRYVYAASALVALAFAAKENAVVYLLVWAGATVLLADHLLFGPRTDESGVSVVRRYWSSLGDSVRSVAVRGVATYGSHAVGVLVVFLLVAGFFFAPRNPGDGVGLWSALGTPTMLPELVDATVADVTAGFEYWFGGTTNPGCHEDNVVDAYACFLGQFVETLWVAALPLTLFAVGGFLYERFAQTRPRLLVMFASYWGFVSVVGYPLGTDIYGAWITINAIVPLAIPAAVGLAYFFRMGRDAFVADDHVSVALVGIVFLLVVGQIGAVAGTNVYGSPADESNNLVQFAQPTDDFRPAFERTESVAGDESLHVVVHGETLLDGGSPMPPRCASQREFLPLNWYVAKHDLESTCELDAGDVADLRPPLVVTADPDAELQRELAEYEVRTYDSRAPGEPLTLFVRADVADGVDLGGRQGVPDDE